MTNSNGCWSSAKILISRSLLAPKVWVLFCLILQYTHMLDKVCSWFRSTIIVIFQTSVTFVPFYGISLRFSTHTDGPSLCLKFCTYCFCLCEYKLTVPIKWTEIRSFFNVCQWWRFVGKWFSALRVTETQKVLAICYSQNYVVMVVVWKKGVNGFNYIVGPFLQFLCIQLVPSLLWSSMLTQPPSEAEVLWGCPMH